MTTTANEPARPVSPTNPPGPVTAADTPQPQVGFLSNGQYSVAITDARAGVSTSGGAWKQNRGQSRTENIHPFYTICPLKRN
jgi:hypothetical protein